MKSLSILVLVFFSWQGARAGNNDLPSIQDFDFKQNTVGEPFPENDSPQSASTDESPEEQCRKLRLKKRAFEEDRAKIIEQYEVACATDADKCNSLRGKKEKFESEFPKIMKELKEKGCAYNPIPKVRKKRAAPKPRARKKK